MVVLNAGVIPAVAWGIAEITPMDSKYVPGLVLATLGAGSAASLKAAQLAKRADLPLAVSVVVVLQLVNIAAVPLWAGQVVTGASISAWAIVKSLLLVVLLPLMAGLIIRARYADHAKAWQPELVKAANLALVVALATGISANWSTIVSMFGSWVIVTAIIIIIAGALGLLPGLLLGGRSAEIRTTSGMVSVFRFASLGLIIIGAQAARQSGLPRSRDHLCAGRLHRPPRLGRGDRPPSRNAATSAGTGPGALGAPLTGREGDALR